MSGAESGVSYKLNQLSELIQLEVGIREGLGSHLVGHIASVGVAL